MGAAAVFRLGSGAGFLPAAVLKYFLCSFSSLLDVSPMHVSGLENERLHVAFFPWRHGFDECDTAPLLHEVAEPVKHRQVENVDDNMDDTEDTADAWECDTGPPTCVESAPKYPSQDP